MLPLTMALSPEQRIRLGLDEPPAATALPAIDGGPMADEFGAGAPALYQPPVRTPNLKLVLGEGERASAPKIRSMVNELLAGNIDNANYWLQQVGAANPKVAVELFIELAQFSLPKLKAVAVQVNDSSASDARTLTFEQLQQALHGD